MEAERCVRLSVCVYGIVLIGTVAGWPFRRGVCYMFCAPVCVGRCVT